MKDSPPQNAPTKAGKSSAVARQQRKAAGESNKQRKPSPTKREKSPTKRPGSPSKQQQKDKKAETLPGPKGKTHVVSPTSKKYPEMSETERRLAEADAYLRKI